MQKKPIFSYPDRDWPDPDLILDKIRFTTNHDKTDPDLDPTKFGSYLIKLQSYIFSLSISKDENCRKCKNIYII